MYFNREKNKNFFTNLVTLSILLLFPLFLASCGNEHEVQGQVETDIDVELNINMPDSVYNAVNKKLDVFFAKRANRQGTFQVHSSSAENEAEEILHPLVDIGEEIKNQLLEFAKSGKLSIDEEDLEGLETMEDSQLAGMAYFFYTIARDNGDEEDKGEYKYTKQDLVDCMSATLGIELAGAVWGYLDGTAALMTAKTAWQIGRAFIGRTFGWIGVAVLAYNYGQCLYERGKKAKKE